LSQNPKSPSSFLDDPSFQAGLKALDRGLTGPVPADDLAPPAPSPPGAPAEPKSATARPIRTLAQPPAISGAIFPESTLAPEGASPPSSRFARGAARIAQPEWHDTTKHATEPRPLLTLFPPPFGYDRAQGPATVGAPPPQIVRSRLAVPADAAELPPPSEQPISGSASYVRSVAAAVADLERVPEQSGERSIAGFVGRAFILLLLMLAGAAAAAWVFRAQVSQLLNR
jgi:hypothetical protein